MGLASNLVLLKIGTAAFEKLLGVFNAQLLPPTNSFHIPTLLKFVGGADTCRERQ
jgi:hypothetical protein